MDRREALKTMGAAALAQLSASELFAVARGMHGQLQDVSKSGRYIFKSLDPEQNETVVVATELIMPETDTPGAKAARVNEFVDVMLTDWFTEEERDRFRRGVAELDRDDRRFVDLERDEQVERLTALENEALAHQRALETSRSPVAQAQSPAAQPFFAVMKWLTLWGYYTSEVGMNEELGYVVFPGSYDGCAPVRTP